MYLEALLHLLNKHVSVRCKPIHSEHRTIRSVQFIQSVTRLALSATNRNETHNLNTLGAYRV